MTTEREERSGNLDERIAKLFRDEFIICRNIIVTAGIFTVLAPLLKESVTFALDLIKQGV